MTPTREEIEFYHDYYSFSRGTNTQIQVPDDARNNWASSLLGGWLWPSHTTKILPLRLIAILA
jgi:hypothetical protein